MAAGLLRYPDITPGPRMTTSPASPAARNRPAGSMTEISAPAGTPTDPGTRAAGGSGLEVIWWLASVIP